jgi:hypothetical protein
MGNGFESDKSERFQAPENTQANIALSLESHSTWISSYTNGTLGAVFGKSASNSERPAATESEKTHFCNADVPAEQFKIVSFGSRRSPQEWNDLIGQKFFSKNGNQWTGDYEGLKRTLQEALLSSTPKEFEKLAETLKEGTKISDNFPFNYEKYKDHISKITLGREKKEEVFAPWSGGNSEAGKAEENRHFGITIGDEIALKADTFTDLDKEMLDKCLRNSGSAGLSNALKFANAVLAESKSDRRLVEDEKGLIAVAKINGDSLTVLTEEKDRYDRLASFKKDAEAICNILTSKADIGLENQREAKLASIFSKATYDGKHVVDLLVQAIEKELPKGSGIKLSTEFWQKDYKAHYVSTPGRLENAVARLPRSGTASFLNLTISKDNEPVYLKKLECGVNYNWGKANTRIEWK